MRGVISIILRAFTCGWTYRVSITNIGQLPPIGIRVSSPIYASETNTPCQILIFTALGLLCMILYIMCESLMINTPIPMFTL